MGATTPTALWDKDDGYYYTHWDQWDPMMGTTTPTAWVLLLEYPPTAWVLLLDCVCVFLMPNFRNIVLHHSMLLPTTSLHMSSSSKVTKARSKLAKKVNS